MNNIKAAIFDLDGTLVDSMWVWEQIDIDYLANKGHSVPNNLKDKINHLSFIQVAEYFKKTFNIEQSPEQIITEWNSMALDFYLNKVMLKSGALKFLQKLKENNIKIGLATSNSKPLLEATLKSNGIYHMFDSITTTDEVDKGKNNPDVYLLAASKLNVSPTDCVVFEDIVQAVKGAKLANMKVVAVFDKSAEYQKEDLIKLADKYIIDYTELL